LALWAIFVLDNFGQKIDRSGLVLTRRNGSAVRRQFDSDIPQLQFLWTRGIAARETMYYLDRHGINAEPLLAAAELSRAQLMQAPGGVSVVSQHRFLELAASEIDDSLLGLRVAGEMDLRDIGLLFYLSASSATVAEALEHLAQYAATMNEEIRLEIRRRKHESILTFRHVLESEDPRRQHSEMITLAFNRVLRTLTNRDFAPSRITFAHARDSGLKELHCILRCVVEFAQPTDSWVLPQRVMTLPIISEDSRLLEILKAQGNHLLSQRRSAAGLRSLVEERLGSLLPSGRVQATSVAEQLGMSVRSLTRNLAEEGTSFGEVLDHLRHRLALRYLRDKHASLQQIAWLLGYSEIAAFNHAFRRWTGTSPGRVRGPRIPEGNRFRGPLIAEE
jgi:AraC-like DNA-binding protein